MSLLRSTPSEGPRNVRRTGAPTKVASPSGGPILAGRRRWPASAGARGFIDVDVCIVGGGYTGLWTAYYLAHAAPGLKIAVLESVFCGYGASGRNGGWLSALLPGPRHSYGPGVAALECRHAGVAG